MINSVGLAALQELRTFEGFENAIIAGGFVRDSVLGGDFKDIDIFVPTVDDGKFELTVRKNYKQILKDNFMKKISAGDMEYYKISGYEIVKLDDGTFNVKTPTWVPEIGNFTGFSSKSSRDYQRFIEKYDCKYLNKIDVDIMPIVHTDKEKSFGDFVVDTFSYNIDKVYFDGEDIISTEEFERDRRNQEATLCKIDSIDEMVGAMRKFERLYAKYPNFIWRTDCIEVKNKKDKEDRTRTKFQFNPKRNIWED